MKRIISAKTCMEFREYFVGRCVLREISNAFDAYEVCCDLDYQPPKLSGERRILVEQYYHTVDWTDQKSVSRVLNVFANEVSKLFAPKEAVDWFMRTDCEKNDYKNTSCNEAKKLVLFLKQDGFEWQDGKFVEPISSASLCAFLDLTQKLEGSHLAKQIQRMKDAVESDPSLAIGTAKELIETTCKTILEERGMPAIGTPDISTLTKALLKELSLVPEGVEKERRGSDLIKSILKSLGTIGNDLAQLRGLYGTGHGKSAKTQSLQSRHAKLAVGAASMFVTFVFETHQENQRKHKV